MRKLLEPGKRTRILIVSIPVLVISLHWLQGTNQVLAADTPRSAQRWEEVIKGAEKEGEVTVYATNSVGDLQVIWDAFRKKFSKIKLNSVAISTTSEIVTKVMAEVMARTPCASRPLA
jgi:tripartite-type tricarboxylate transporter receptor subunit TctC